MSDRCYMEVRCKKEHAPIFEKLGFVIRDEDYAPGIVELADEQANYAHSGDMPNEVPYFGWHDAGGNYGPHAFACDGNGYVEAHMDPNGELVVRVSDRGQPNKTDTQGVREYVACLKRAKKALGLLPKPSKRHAKEVASER